MNPFRILRRWIIARRIRAILPLARVNWHREKVVAIIQQIRGLSADMAHDIEVVRLSATDLKGLSQGHSPQLDPGRQRIAMPADSEGFGPFSTSKAWSLPAPAHARSAWWEELHTFAPGARPTRHSVFGLQSPEPPIALVCPACELQQTPIRQTSETRTCGYCGLKLRAHGTRVFWWREAMEVPEWKP